MGKSPSNFNERALRESRARDKKREYGKQLALHGEGVVDWTGRTTPPVMSGKIVGDDGTKYVYVRQGVTTNKNYYFVDDDGKLKKVPEKVGIQSRFRVDDDGTLIPDEDYIPDRIRFKYSPNDSFAGGTWDKIEAWSDMIRDKIENLPSVDTMPLLSDEQKHEEEWRDGYGDDIDKYDREHKGAGKIGEDISPEDEALFRMQMAEKSAKARAAKGLTPLNGGDRPQDDIGRLSDVNESGGVYRGAFDPKNIKNKGTLSDFNEKDIIDDVYCDSMNGEEKGEYLRKLLESINNNMTIGNVIDAISSRKY